MTGSNARRRPPARRAAALLGRTAAIAAVTFALLEIALRVRAGLPSEAGELDLADAAAALPPPYAGSCGGAADASLGQLLRPSRTPDLLFELKPGVDTCAWGARVTVNAEGLRAPGSYARPKPPGAYRVLLLGDSQAFGQGVPYDQTFGALLEAELGRRAASRRVEVINSGVPAYNTVQEAASFAASGVGYQPDCVVVLFIANDLELADFLLEPGDGLSLRRSFAAAGIADVLWGIGRRRGLDGSTISPSRLSLVPAAHRHMVGLEAYRGALRRIAGTARTAGIPVVDLADYRAVGFSRPRRATEALSALHREIGIALPELEFPNEPRFWLSDADRHLNAGGTAELVRRALGGVLAACRLPE